MSGRVGREKPGVDDSVIDLIAVIAFTVIVVSLIVAAALGDSDNQGTILTLSKAVVPAVVFIGLAIFGRRVALGMLQIASTESMLSVAAIGAFAGIVVAVTVAVLVGNNDVQDTLLEIVTDYLPVFATAIGAVIGFAAGGSRRIRRVARTDAGDRLFEAPSIIAMTALVGLVVIVLAIIFAIVYGDELVPDTIVDLVDSLLPVIAVLVGFAGGVILAAALPERGDEVSVLIVEEETL
jgi:putative Ca2+/H+ antiporter (TMEM165/GDT1 family)